MLVIIRLLSGEAQTGVSFAQLCSVLKLEVTVKAETLLCRGISVMDILLYIIVHGAVIAD